LSWFFKATCRGKNNPKNIIQPPARRMTLLTPTDQLSLVNRTRNSMKRRHHYSGINDIAMPGENDTLRETI
jgi:hypothetical protein